MPRASSPITTETLRPWGSAAVHGEPAKGSVNPVRYATVNGLDCVVRASPRSEPTLRWELELLHDVAAVGLGVAPIVPTASGEPCHDGIVVFRRVAGRHPTSRDDCERVAEYLTRLHTAPLILERGQRPGFLAARDLLAVDVGGDIDLRAMPESDRQRCRRAWARLGDHPTAVIHGDPNPTNIFLTDDGVVMVDWDECRVDTPLFDLASLPDEVSPLAPDQRWAAQQAASAWEAAIFWTAGPEYAKKRMRDVE